MERENYEVVIAGAGAAGFMAALELGKNGKKVLLLEKGKTPAVSNFAKAGGPAAADTNIQKCMQMPLTADTLYQHMSSWARYTVNEALLRDVIACTGAAVDAMEQAGIRMELIPDTYGVGFRARHIIRQRAKERAEILTKAVQTYGGTVVCEREVTGLLLNEREVVGVEICGANGKKERIFARKVLLCTGGFQNNKEMIRRYFGLNHMVSMGNPLATGDGIRLAEEAGAVLDRNFALPGNEGSATTSKGKGYNDHLCFGIYGGLLTDHNGRRFMNEKHIADFPLAIGGEAFARHEKSYAVLDEEMYQGCVLEGIYAYMGKPENWLAGQALWHPVLKNAPNTLEAAIAEGWAWKADTIAELAEHFGLMDLEDTVSRYNKMCENRKDTEFGKAENFLLPIKKAPFYIFEYEPACWCTIGGIKTDSKLHALDADGMPIQGLYIAGVDNGSMFCVPYYDNEGAALGLSLGSGILAARWMLKE